MKLLEQLEMKLEGLLGKCSEKIDEQFEECAVKGCYLCLSSLCTMANNVLGPNDPLVFEIEEIINSPQFAEAVAENPEFVEDVKANLL